MSPEAQKQRIAEADGWTDFRLAITGAGAPEREPSLHGKPPGRSYIAKVPNYPHSLDLIQSVVVKQPKPIQEQFACELAKRRTATLRMHHQLTARDWCETLIRVLGLWVEEKDCQKAAP